MWKCAPKTFLILRLTPPPRKEKTRAIYRLQMSVEHVMARRPKHVLVFRLFRKIFKRVRLWDRSIASALAISWHDMACSICDFEVVLTWRENGVISFAYNNDDKGMICLFKWIVFSRFCLRLPLDFHLIFSADLTQQLTIKGSNLDESDHKLQLKWSKPQPHLETPTHPGEYAVGLWPPKGRVYWKLPFKVSHYETPLWCEKKVLADGLVRIWKSKTFTQG